jgi:hypothetical protein
MSTRAMPAPPSLPPCAVSTAEHCSSIITFQRIVDSWQIAKTPAISIKTLHSSPNEMSPH